MKNAPSPNPFACVRAALFDLDGTLVETHIDFPQMKREILRLAGEFRVEAAGLEQLDILGVVEEARARLASASVEESARFRAEAFALLETIEIEQCAAPVRIAGASELLLILRDSGVRVAIVTRNCRTVSCRLLVFAGLACDALLTRDDVPRTKPDPAHLHAALEAVWGSVDGYSGLQALRCSGGRGFGGSGVGVQGLGDGVERSGVGVQGSGVGGEGLELPAQNSMLNAQCSTPAQCWPSANQLSTISYLPSVMTGDHWMDVRAGRAAGLRTVGISRGRDAGFYNACPPDLVVTELAELVPLAQAAAESGP